MGCRLSKRKKENIVSAMPDNRSDFSMMDDGQITCSIYAEWKFYKSDLMDVKKNGKIGKFYYPYNIPGLQYYVMVFPNGIVDEYPGEAFLTFRVTGLDERNVVTELTFSVESANFSHKLNYAHEAGTMCGLHFGKSREFLGSKSKFFVEGILTVKVKGILKASRPLFSQITIPISYQWKIKEEDLKAKTETHGTLKSEEINVPTFSGTKYYLELCPCKIKDTNESAAFLYLKTESETEKEIKAVYDVSVDSAHFSCGMEYVCEGYHSCATALCLTKDLFDPAKRFIVNSCLTVNVNGILMIEKNHFITLKCKNNLAPESQKKNEKEFLVFVGEKHIHVHKKVLINVSSVLAEMFEFGTIQDKITIKGFCFKIVDAAIKLCYSADASFEFTLEEMLSLYQFGDKYRIKLVMDIAGDYLIHDISPSNVVYLIKFSSPDSFNVVKLHQSCIDFLIKCMKESTPIYALS